MCHVSAPFTHLPAFAAPLFFSSLQKANEVPDAPLKQPPSGTFTLGKGRSLGVPWTEWPLLQQAEVSGAISSPHHHHPPPRNRLIPAPQVPFFSKGRASDTSVSERTVSAPSPTGPSQLPPSQGRWTRKTAAPDLGLFPPDPSGGSKNRLRRSFQTGSFQTGSSQAGSRLVLSRLALSKVVLSRLVPGCFSSSGPEPAEVHSAACFC